MPDLPALKNINDIIMMAPEISILILQPAVVYRHQGIPAGKFPAPVRRACDMCI